MAEDFRRTSETSLPINLEGSTSFILFTEDLEGQVGSDSGKCLAVSNDDEKLIFGGSSEVSSRNCTSLEEGSIPASVKELLTLLVNRAAQNENEGLLAKEDRQLSDGSGKAHFQNESWTSSMATPTKYNSTAIEANDSTLVNFKFETSDLDVPEDKNKVVSAHATSVNESTEEAVISPSNCITSRIDDPDSTSVSATNNSFLEDEPIPNRESKPLIDRHSLNSGQEKQNIDNHCVINCPDNSFLEELINISVADEHADIGTSFLMSTPVKEHSIMKINFNPRKYSFASVSLPLENDIDEKSEDKSMMEENLVGNQSPGVKKDPVMSCLSLNNVSEENLDISDSNSQSLLRNITPAVNYNSNNQEMSCKINARGFISVTEELETTVTDAIAASDVAEKNCNGQNKPSEKTNKKAFGPRSVDTICDTEPVSESVICNAGYSDKDISSNDLTGEMATVVISSVKADVQRDLFESLHNSSMESMMTIVQGARRSTSDDIFFRNITPLCSMQEMLVPSTEGRVLNDQEICYDQNKLFTSESEEVVLMDDSRSECIGACARDTSVQNEEENAPPITEDVIFSDHEHLNDEPISCSAESMKTVITCSKRSTDNVHCESLISSTGGEMPPNGGNTNVSQSKSNSEQFLCYTDLMQTVPVNDTNITTTVNQYCANDLSNANSPEKIETVILGDCCSSIKDVECNKRKLSIGTEENTEMDTGIKNATIYTLILKGKEDKMECAISDKNDEEATCRSGIDDDKEGQLNVLKEDLNGISHLSPTLAVVCTSKDQITMPQPVNNFEKEELIHGSKAFPLNASGSQNTKLEGNMKHFESSEGCISVISEKTEFERGKALESGLVDKEKISPSKPTSIISDLDDLQKKMDEPNIETETSPELNEACQRKEVSDGTNFCEEVFIDEQLKVNGNSQSFSETDKNEINLVHHNNPEPVRKSSKEDLMDYELDSSIMENFFSETMEFECDKTLVQTQDVVIQNPLRNSGEIFDEPKCPMSASSDRDPVNDHNVVMKTEIQDACTSPSQDFLPSSVLEEVCQATEALVYHGKGKNECHLDYVMETEFLNSDLDNFEADEQKNIEKKIENDERMKQSESNVRNSNINQILMSERLENSTVVKTKPVNEEESIKEETKNNLKKKILFTASECVTLSEDIEVEMRTDNEVKTIKQGNKYTETPDNPFTVKQCKISECLIEDNSAVTKEKEAYRVRSSSAKFIYPKRGKKINNLLQERVNVEDLMASAVALEKCSTFFPKAKASDIQLLKNETLVCFNSLEASLNKITNESGDDNLLSRDNKDIGDHLEECKRKEVNWEVELGMSQLNDDNGDMSYFMAAVKNEEILLNPEVCASNLSENEMIKGRTKETDSECVHSKLAPLCASNLSKNEMMESSSKESFSDSGHCKSGQNLGTSEQEKKKIGQEQIETERKDEQCTSPILKKRINSRRNFRRGGKIHRRTLRPHNESSIEKLEDMPMSSGSRSVIFLENVSQSLREKSKEESHGMNPICEALKDDTGPQSNSTKMTKNVEEANNPAAFSKEEEDDLFYEGDSLFMSSNLEYALASEQKISVSGNDWVQSKNLFAEEGNSSKKASQYPDKAEKENLENSRETGPIQENILVDNFTLLKGSDPFCKNVCIEKNVLEDDSSTPAISQRSECALVTGKIDIFSEKMYPQGQKILSGEDFSETSYSAMSDEGKSKGAVLENISKEVQQTNPFQRDNFFLDENCHNGFFLTASGMKLSVSEEAIQKAEKMFSEEAMMDSAENFTEVGNMESTLKENYTEECKINAKYLGEQSKIKPGSTSVSHNKTLFCSESQSISERNIIESDISSRNESIRFSTASGKKVPVSEKALMNARKIFSEETSRTLEEQSTLIDHERHPYIHKRQLNQDSSRCTSVGISKEELTHARELFSKEISSAIQDFDRDLTHSEKFTTSRDRDGSEFSTASGKKVSFSKKALMQAQKIFTEETRCEMQDFQKEIQTNENVTPARNAIEFGFSTGSGKRVAVSKKALMKAQKLFSEVNESTIQELQTNKPVVENLTPARSTERFGFSTESGEKVSISRKALLQVQNLSSVETKSTNHNFLKDEVINKNVKTSNKTVGIGFSTGSGKKITVSKKALMKAQKIYSEVNDSLPDGIQKDQESDEAIISSKSMKGLGFSTASSEKLSISERSSMQAEKLFSAVNSSTIQEFSKDQISNDNKNPSQSIDELGLSTTCNKKFTDSREKLVQAPQSKETESEMHEFQTTAVTNQNATPFRSTERYGFSTGSGKRVTISKKALLQAQKLYSEVSDSVEKESPRDQVTNETVTPARSADGYGFSTGSGKRVTVSKKALLQAQKLYSEVSDSVEKESPRDQVKNETATPARSADGYGFSTGSGKRVSVSKKALLQAQKLYSEVSDSVEKESPRDQVTNETVTPARSADGYGFSTGSGKRVSVSKKALLQAQKLYSEVSDSVEKESPRDQVKNETATPARSADGYGFSTGSGKRVSVSKKALLQAQKLYSEVSDSVEKESPRDQVTNETVTPARSADGYGFSTGSGKRVTVSKKALLQAQKLYSEVSDSVKTDSVSSLAINETATPARSTGGCGFSTGSGKRVTVSQKALEQAQKLFSEAQDFAIQDFNEDIVTNEFIIPPKNERRLSMASGNKATISKEAPLQARKLYSEVSNIDMKEISKNKLCYENETKAKETNEFGCSTGSGKRVRVSEKSLLLAKNKFMEDSGSKFDVLGCSDFRKGISSESENSSMQPEIQSSEGSFHKIQDSINADSKDRIALGVSSGGGKRFASPAKSLSLAKKACLEGVLPSTSKSLGFSTVSGREVALPEKDSIHSKKLFHEEIDSNQGKLPSRPCSEKGKEVTANETHIDTEQLSSECCLQQKDGADSPVFSKISSRRSLSMVRKLFAEDSLSVTSNFSIQETELARKFVDSPDVARKSVSVNMQEDGGTPLSVKSVMRSELDCKNNVIRVEEEYLIKNLRESGQKAFTVEKSKVKANDDPQNSNLTSRNGIGKKCAANKTLSTLFAESQGDNYIKAVDLALLNSPAVTEHPPSPVFKRNNQRRQRFKAVPSSQIKRKESSVSTASTAEASVSPANSNFPSDTLSKKSIQLPCSTSHKDERNSREKEIDLWGTDLAEESWLGKQLDLAEASNQLDTNSFIGDIWNAARKRQEEVISSKKNIRPVVGKHYQERRMKGSSLRSSLRDLVMGKRPGHYSKEELRKFNVRESTLKVTAKNAAEYQFLLKDHYGQSIKSSGVTVEDGIVLVPNPDGKFGADEAQAALLAAPGVDPSLLPPGGWCQNHFRWIVWKLACSERSFPEELGGRYFTPENVMRQLKYRWDREIDGGERPALRKILEMDDTASKRIVLCISSIERPENIQSSKKLELDLISSSTKLELTDGWYAIRGIIDIEMASLVQKGKLSIGTKIVTSGAELVNGPSNGCHPLEPPAAKAAIRLNTNSTRRARWDVKLGYVFKNPGPLPVSLRSLLPGGGAVSALRNVILARVYPILNVEKTADGRKVVRSQKAEARVAAKFERQRQMWIENIYSQVSAEIQKEEEEEARLTRQGKRARSEQTISNHNSKRPKRYPALDKKVSAFTAAPSPEDLLRLIEESEDSSSFQSLLTSSQLKMVMDYKQEERERRQRELEERVRQRIKEEEEKASTSDRSNSSVASFGLSGGNIKRDVVAVLKARLVDADQPVVSKSAVLTIWRPSEDVISLLAKEGATLNLYNLSSNGMRSSFLQLSTNRQTRYKVKTHLPCQMDLCPSLQRIILSRAFDDYISQKASKLGSAADCMPPFGEVDLVALVIKIGDEPEKERGVGYQNVFVAGSDGSLLSLAFWGGIMEFALDEILMPGVTIVATNLQWRRHHGLARLPTVHAVETSTFSQHPGEERLKNALKKFECELKDEMQLVANKNSGKSDFLSYCEEKLAAVTGVGSKVDNNLKAFATSNAKSDLPVNSPSERIISLRPSVAARMKKLQMYEGVAEIPLPVCHVKASPLAMKTFQPPARCASPKPSNVDNQACEEVHPDSSPMSLDSDL